MMSDITEARRVLRAWRDHAPVEMAMGGVDPGEGWFQVNDTNGRELFVAETWPVAVLIVGISGNPALLDALDTLLEQAEIWDGDPEAAATITATGMMATAIVAAERVLGS